MSTGTAPIAATTPPAVAQGVAVVQRRWTLLVVEALLRRGPLRFVDLRGELRGVSPNVLAQRLRELTADGVVAHRRLAAPAASWVYELTAHGRRLEPVLRELASWAQLDPSGPSWSEVREQDIGVTSTSTSPGVGPR